MLREMIAERRTYEAHQFCHDHEYAQLIIPLEGELSIQTKHQFLQIGEEQLFFIPPKLEHTFYSQGRNEFLVLDIPAIYFHGDQLKQLEHGTTYQLNDKWKAIRFLLLHELESSGAQPAVKELFPYLARQIFEQANPRSIQYIHEHYVERLSIQDLASIEHYHPAYYTEWFSKKTGKTPTEYIQAIRIEKAKELLLHTSLSIQSIAFQVGFEHQASLTRLFQQLVGMTPSQYRKVKLSKRST